MPPISGLYDLDHKLAMWHLENMNNPTGWGTRVMLLALCVLFVTQAAGPVGLGAWRQLALAPSLAQSLPLIHVGQAHELGATGRGVTVLIIDNFTPNPLDPCHDFVHGQWVEGILSAVAPEARILRLDVPLELPGTSKSPCFAFSTQTLSQALASALELHNQMGIGVINYSIGQGRFTDNCPAGGPEGRLIHELVQAGVIFVAAAGNQAFADALSFPSCMPDALSIGAVYDYADTELELAGICADFPVPDKVACYSNSAPFLDVLAPGSLITVTDALSNIGTSAAAPHVAGVIALLLQLEPSLSLDEVRQLLRQTGKPVLDQRNGLTFPRVDALAAVQAVLALPQARPLERLVRALDADGDGRVGDEEILVAIEHWIAAQPLPGTRLTLSDEAIVALVALWITAEPMALPYSLPVW